MNSLERCVLYIVKRQAEKSGSANVIDIFNIARRMKMVPLTDDGTEAARHALLNLYRTGKISKVSVMSFVPVEDDETDGEDSGKTSHMKLAAWCSQK